jgi:hypothetical protein
VCVVFLIAGPEYFVHIGEGTFRCGTQLTTITLAFRIYEGAHPSPPQDSFSFRDFDYQVQNLPSFLFFSSVFFLSTIYSMDLMLIC